MSVVRFDIADDGEKPSLTPCVRAARCDDFSEKRWMAPSLRHIRDVRAAQPLGRAAFITLRPSQIRLGAGGRAASTR
jgi:hypothetical protein